MKACIFALVASTAWCSAASGQAVRVGPPPMDPNIAACLKDLGGREGAARREFMNKCTQERRWADKAAPGQSKGEGNSAAFGIRFGQLVTLPRCQFFMGNFIMPDGTDMCAYSVGEQGATVKFSRTALPGWVRGGQFGLESYNSLVAGLKLDVLQEGAVAAFNEKYGESQVEVLSMQNNAGATWQGKVFRWKTGQVLAEVRCTDFRENVCTAQVTDIRAAALRDQDLKRRDAQARPL